jgi:hypothetical protein
MIPQPPFNWTDVLNLIVNAATWLGNLVAQHPLPSLFVFLGVAALFYLPEIVIVLLLIVGVALAIKYFGDVPLHW